MYRDTGATVTVVHPHVICDTEFLENMEVVRLANGTVDEVPKACAILRIGENEAVSEVMGMQCPCDILPGNNLEHLCGAVVTRAESQLTEELKDEEKRKLKPKPKNIKKILR